MNRDVVLQKINSVQNCLKRIKSTLSNNTKNLSDLDAQDIIVLNLQRAIQASIDTASYILAEKKLGTASSLRETFLILEQNKIITHKTSSQMQKMVGFRNIAVHAYQQINEDILDKILSAHLGDFESFNSEILELV